MIFRTLKHDELEAWFAHCQGVFALDDPNYFRNHFSMDPQADVSMIFVAMDGETIAATVRVFRRTVWLHGRAVKCGGIGEVSTKPEYRRRGLVSELLELAIAAMVADGMHVSILFGNQGIYERAGWRFCDRPISIGQVKDLPRLPDDVRIRKFEETDLAFAMGIYDLFAGKLDGAIVRDEAYWKRWVLPQWAETSVLVQSGQVVAYCTVKPDSEKEKQLNINEMCAAPQAEKMLPAMMRDLALEKECGQVRYATPLLSEHYGAEQTIEGHLMVRLNIPFDEVNDSDMLVAYMRNAGMFAVDAF